jgi:hypothetical protein
MSWLRGNSAQQCRLPAIGRAKSAHPLGIGLILVRVLVKQIETLGNFVVGISNINASRAALALSQRPQRDESDDAICRLPFSSRVRDELNTSAFTWGSAWRSGTRERDNVALYRFSAIPWLLVGENWLGILVRTESNPGAPRCSRGEVLRRTPEVRAKTFTNPAAIMAVLLSDWGRVGCEQLTVDE